MMGRVGARAGQIENSMTCSLRWLMIRPPKLACIEVNWPAGWLDVAAKVRRVGQIWTTRMVAGWVWLE